MLLRWHSGDPERAKTNARELVQLDPTFSSSTLTHALMAARLSTSSVAIVSWWWPTPSGGIYPQMGRTLHCDAYSLGERLTTAVVTLIVVLSQDHPNSPARLTMTGLFCMKGSIRGQPGRCCGWRFADNRGNR